ncbi:3-phosphoshikimate 1-carboxyvinyltransferase [Marinihelvus fidelis]|nr:3-phosphoshikimate 1-carboxyvinyltransferase [Marinihelvus fidelis]
MPLYAKKATAPLAGTLTPPGDKSISHRALIFGGLADGETVVEGLLVSADTTATRNAMVQLGASVTDEGDVLRIRGLGQAGLSAPSAPLDMGNSGTAMRLLAGVLAAQSFDSVLTGDASLNSRPMRRIMTPLAQMGANVEATEAGTAPLHIHGNPALKGIHYDSPVASAQIKSCVLLAGLFAQGESRVTEPRLSRDHTERMLPLFGVRMGEGAALQGPQGLTGAKVLVPSDPSSAAFLVAVASLVPGSDVTLRNVGLNPTRSAFFDAVKAMGGRIDIETVNDGSDGLEPVGDLRVRYNGRLKGIDLPPEWVPAMIDEIPILMALAATAQGRTRVTDAAELRVKESDRLAVMARGLECMGIELSERPDGVDVFGGEPCPARVEAENDHRCAMSFAVLGQLIEEGVLIDGADYIDTSYPGFSADMLSIGAQLERRDG